MNPRSTARPRAMIRGGFREGVGHRPNKTW
jgi:hypothetical protein